MSRLIGIVGHGNGTGKTLFIQRLLQAHAGRFAAVKFTTVFKDGNCPKDAQRRCACTRLHDAFTVISDDETIRMRDTDTGRIAEAGASPVVWCLAQPDQHAEAWKHVVELLPAGRDVLTEGNSALAAIPSDAMIFLVNPSVPRKFWKANWKPLAERAHAIVVNDAPETPRIVARLDAPWEDWAGDLLEELVTGAGA